MTDAQILAIAYGYEQYPGSKEPTLRGQAIVEFARALMEWQPIETAAPHVRALLYAPPEQLYSDPSGLEGEMRVARPQNWTWARYWMPLPPPPEAQTHLPTVVDAAVDGAVCSPAYQPPGTHGSAAAPKVPT